MQTVGWLAGMRTTNCMAVALREAVALKGGMPQPVAYQRFMPLSAEPASRMAPTAVLQVPVALGC